MPGAREYTIRQRAALQASRVSENQASNAEKGRNMSTVRRVFLNLFF
jgi:hypothetical protein